LQLGAVQVHARIDIHELGPATRPFGDLLGDLGRLHEVRPQDGEPDRREHLAAAERRRKVHAVPDVAEVGHDLADLARDVLVGELALRDVRELHVDVRVRRAAPHRAAVHVRVDELDAVELSDAVADIDLRSGKYMETFSSLWSAGGIQSRPTILFSGKLAANVPTATSSTMARWSSDHSSMRPYERSITPKKRDSLDLAWWTAGV